MIRQLPVFPLFPLETVLFPGGSMNLHIFEERYRLLIAHCLERNIPFGVILLRASESADEERQLTRAAEPYTVGTLAQISANVRLEDGRYLITVAGQQRFRIQYVLQRSPYIIAAVVELPEEQDQAADAAAQDLRSTYERYWQAINFALGPQTQPDELPEDAAAMSYRLAERFQVSFAQKQHWLELELAPRLRELTNELRHELMLLPAPRQPKDPDQESGTGNLN